MRKQIFTCFAWLFAAFIFVLAGCSKNNEGSKKWQHITLYKPVYKLKTEVLAKINDKPATPVTKGGKFYLYGKYILVNDPNKGIHVFDNSNSSNPRQVAFLNIPGNVDIAVKDNILYADMYTDLLALDISDVRHAKVTSDINKVFAHSFYDKAGYYSNYNNDSLLVAVDFIAKDTIVDYYENPSCVNCEIFLSANTAYKSSNSGTAGSMAAMVLVKDHMYAIGEQHSLSIIDIKQPAHPKLSSVISAGFDLETIYPLKDKLFLGSGVGVFMYDISDAETPVLSGTFEHGRACDPVIADGDFAYVTLHSGSSCGGDFNEMDVLNISNLANPVPVKSYMLTSPTGLSKDGNLLFVCDGNSGVKIFDVSTPANAKLLKQLPVKDPYDVILQDHIAYIIAKDGLYQYAYNKNAVTMKISRIPISFKQGM